MRQRTRITLKIAWSVLILALATPAGAGTSYAKQEKEGGKKAEEKKEKKEEKKEERKEEAAKLPAVLWRDPGDVSKLHVLHGAGGKEHAPDPKSTYTFLDEPREGHSPKFDAKDEQGVRWKVKMGQKPQAQVAASRLLWAAGFFQDEDYYLPQIKVTGLPAQLVPRRSWFGRRVKSKDEELTFISPDGTVLRVDLKRYVDGVKTLEEEWDWFNNPFTGTREFNGLRVMMALLNNWDTSSDNNKVYLVNGERRYVVNDPGSSFGKTGNPMQRSKGILVDYVNSPFIEKATPDYVDFVMHSRPPSLEKVFNKKNYIKRTRIEEVAKHIPRADARWMGERLALLSEEQVRDCFRAGGYTPEAVEGYTKAVEKRIAALKAL